MADLDLDAIRRRAEEAEERASGATEGPWVAYQARTVNTRETVQFVQPKGEKEEFSNIVCEESTLGDPSDGGRGNMAFIAAARTDVPALVFDVRILIAENKRLREEVNALEDRLDSYADILNQQVTAAYIEAKLVGYEQGRKDGREECSQA